MKQYLVYGDDTLFFPMLLGDTDDPEEAMKWAQDWTAKHNKPACLYTLKTIVKLSENQNDLRDHSEDQTG